MDAIFSDPALDSEFRQRGYVTCPLLNPDQAASGKVVVWVDGFKPAAEIRGTSRTRTEPGQSSPHRADRPVKPAKCPGDLAGCLGRVSQLGRHRGLNQKTIGQPF